MIHCKSNRRHRSRACVNSKACGAERLDFYYGNNFTIVTNYSTGAATQRTEHDGSITKFTYDAKHRETSRVEKAGTASAKTYTTQWHETWNLPLLKTEPGKITAYTYDAKGNMTGQAEVPTTDANGSKGVAGLMDMKLPINTVAYAYDHQNLVVGTHSTKSEFGKPAVVTERSQRHYDSLGQLTTLNTSGAVIGTNHIYISRYTQLGRPLSVIINGREMVDYLTPWFEPINKTNTLSAALPSYKPKRNMLSLLIGDAHAQTTRPSLRPDGQPWGYGCGSADNDHLVPDSYKTANFLSSCRDHDNCYDKCGATKATCDTQFLSDLKTACKAGGSPFGCDAVALVYYLSVDKIGQSAYDAAQKKCKKC